MKKLSAIVTLLLIVAAPMEARAFWNTGLASVTNNYSKSVRVVDQEDRNSDLGVINVGRPFISKLTIPWCDSTAELQSKALNFMETGPLKILFYLCQNYQDNMVYFVPGNGALWDPNDPVTKVDWASRVRCAPAPASYIDVIIGSNGL